ncbi:MAG TPA: hypothetical protein VHG08_08960 [Longimicrobium sp.]|nr:hypothetical protein [Longimicrobium sp.]
MRRTRRRLVVPLLLLAACEGGGEAVEIASPHDLRIEIVSGKGMRSMVRDPAAPASDPNLTPEPVTVRVSVAGQRNRLAGAGGTGPALEVRLPAVEIHWRTLDSHWCQPWQATTPVVHGDTASNFYRRPTLAGDCRLVAEGVVNGQVFDADTAIATFTPGPVVSANVPERNGFWLPWLVPARLLVLGARDAYGNQVSDFTVSATLLRGGPAISVSGDTLRASQEATGAVSLRIGGTVTREVELWVTFNVASRRWRLTWQCHGLALPGGAHVDSVHYRLDDSRAAYGAYLAPGLYVGFQGILTTRTWTRGEPMRETVVPGSAAYAVQRPFLLEWPNGQTAFTTAFGYEGGTLCEAPPGSAWARTPPVRVERLGLADGS